MIPYQIDTETLIATVFVLLCYLAVYLIRRAVLKAMHREYLEQEETNRIFNSRRE
ncbi:hypothetical protein [Pedobacter antarcticus]|uniref:hypothetical protein n=1 Tax=Pedobacter antarcticus TaxID=34086 RepID=UPI00292E3852|nr:hypothetical protein [Pedobacter antarcticus]